MKTIIFTAIFFLISCGTDDSKKSEKANESKWTAEELQLNKRYCASSIIEIADADEVTYNQAYIYCGCFYEEVAKRWTNEEYTQHEIEYTVILQEEGHVERCVKLSESF